MTIKTASLAAFVSALEHVIDQAREGNLVSASINLDPTGMGRVSVILVGGVAPELPGMDDPAEGPTPNAKPPMEPANER